MGVGMKEENWIQTYSGRKFHPFDPNPDDISIDDIAHSLSMICRYTGHCRRFYSVAEHSVYVSRLVPKEVAMWGLLHDAAEAYLSDVARPVKPHLPLYKEIEESILQCIAKKFELSYPMPPSIKVADNAMLNDEGWQLMGDISDWHVAQGKTKNETGLIVGCWYPDLAKIEFLQRFYDLFYKRHEHPF
jgi:hypothetical protein